MKFRFVIALQVPLCCAPLVTDIQEVLAEQLRITSELAATSEEHADALVEAGQKWAEQLQQNQAALDKAFERLSNAIDLLPTDQFNGQRLAIIELREVVWRLRMQVQNIIADHEAVIVSGKSYKKSIAKIKPLLLTAAGAFAEYARDEPYDTLREDYLLWAETFRGMAINYGEHSTALEPAVEAVVDNLRYVKRTVLLLERLERLLAIPPEESADTEVFLRRLASYVESFERFRTQLRHLHGVVTAGTSSPAEPPSVDSENREKTTSNSARASLTPTLRQTNSFSAPLATRMSGEMEATTEKYASEVLIDFEPKAAAAPNTVPANKVPASIAKRRSKPYPVLRRNTAKPVVPAIERPLPKPGTANAADSQQKLAAENSYSGVWKVSPGNVTIRLAPSGHQVSASLVRSSVVRDVTGLFRTDGEDLLAVSYYYQMPNNTTLSMAGTRFRMKDRNHLTATGPRFRRNALGQYEWLKDQAYHYTLTRVK